MTLRSTGAFRAGVIFLAATMVVLATALLINLSFGLPFNLSVWPPGQDYVLSASFKDANGVTRGADVEIAGHTVGQVTGAVASGNRSIVTMRINQQYAPIHRGSIARIRYSTLLAQKYIELAPVAGPQAIPSGGTIPSTDTITPVDFDQFLSALDPQTRQKLQVVIQQVGSGVDGRQAAINDLLDQLHGLSVESRPPLDTFARHDTNIDHIVGNLAVTSNRLAQSKDNLGQLVGSANDVNARVADQNAALAGLIRHLGNLMGDFNLTLAGNEGNLHQTVVLLDPLIGQVNVTFGTTDGYLSPNLGNLEAGFNQLSPEGESAIHQKDANGNYLRQYLVADPACDQINKTYDPQCGNGSSSSSSPPGAAPPGGSPPAVPGPGGGPIPTPVPTCDPVKQLLGGC
ncbi:MAG TPA: MlaD family protein [Candidatus Dormibacteraeota bacterium]|jgi:phospholipid/cholesterol/gamma-HCH transport system substrate-binding protein